MGFPLAVSVLLDTTNGHHHSSTVVQMPRYARRRLGGVQSRFFAVQYPDQRHGNPQDLPPIGLRWLMRLIVL